MGRALCEALGRLGIPTVVVNPERVATAPNLPVIVGRADAAALQQAGIDEAVGVVAGTDCDEDNLGILLSARKLKPDVFLVVRQNHHENELAFSGVDANLIMQPSLVTARQILQMLTVPTMLDLRRYLRDEGRDLVPRLVARTQALLGDERIHLWTEKLDGRASALAILAERSDPVTLGDIQRAPMDREQRLQVLALVLNRGQERTMLPAEETELEMGDEVLFCGTERGQRLLGANLQNEYTLHYLVHGEDRARTIFSSWFRRLAAG
jgi:Trk K+ transport system NAD-binding subunit